MKSLKIVFISALCCLFTNLFAQTCTITGKVIDSKTEEPIPFANVFLNNTTLGTVTELNGEFNLKNVKQPAVHELVFSFVGYETYKTKISVTADELNMRIIRLKPSETVLNVVEVKGTKDVEWEKNLKTFKRIFLGEDAMAAKCNITNPWVINFKDDVTRKNLVAYASAPIEIENKALGYKLNFYLTQFNADPTTYMIQGNARFIPLKSDDPKIIKEWESNREKSFFGSSQHLFKSIVDGDIRGEGFNVYTDFPGFENSSSRSSEFLGELGKTIMRVDTTTLLSPAAQANTFKITWKGRVEVHYRKEKVTATIYSDIRFPISWVTSKKGFVLVNREGVSLNPSDIVISGAMSKDRVANMLPLDYMPASQTQKDTPEQPVDVYNLLYEKVYVHTDRPYYYPGETIWLKGYMNYAFPVMRDSLSGTSYLELIDGTTMRVVQSKTLKIDSGAFHSDFILPDTLKAAPYLIRAYTNWNRNYGDDHLYSRYVPVLKPLQKPEYIPFDESSSDVSVIISSDKQQYQPREKINLTLQLKDDEGNPIFSNLSISVTDANQVVEVRTAPTILEDFVIKEIPKPISKPSFPVETGIAFTAQVMRGDKKTGKLNLNIFQTYQRNFFPTETDEKGVFSVNGLNFYDNSQFTLKLVKESSGKLKTIKEVQLLPREVPPIIFNSNFQTFPIERTQASQRDKSSFEMAAQTKLLKEVLIQSNKTDELTRRSYGKPDYVLLAKDLNLSYGNLLTALPGKVPGLVVRQDGPGNTIVYISRVSGSSVSNQKEVLVMVNDVFVGGSPAETLGSISPASIESVEVKTGINVLYGSEGGSGIVSVYTKKGAAETAVVHEDQSILTVPGYFRPRVFPAPDYSNPKKESDPVDYRSLIYWNPTFNTSPSTGTASVSFYASDLGGNYRVDVEGVTEKGQPVRAKYMISVEGKKGE